MIVQVYKILDRLRHLRFGGASNEYRGYPTMAHEVTRYFYLYLGYRLLNLFAFLTISH